MSSTESQIKILIAEDQDDLRELYKTQLEHLGYKVKVVTDGLQALNAVITNGIDLVIMDLLMPVMDGYQATRKIREFQKEKKTHLPIVALSSLSEQDNTNIWKTIGIDAYLQKPASLHQLATTINKLVVQK